MDNNMTLKELIKVQALLLLLYIPSDFIVLIFFQGLNTWDKWKIEIVKIFVIMGILCFVAVLSIFLKKFSRRKFFAYVSGLECIIFSIIILVSLLDGYYQIYGKLNLKIIYAYTIVLAISFLIMKKKIIERVIKKDKTTKFQSGWTNCAIVSTLIIAKRLSMDQTYIVNIVISLIICFAWLIFGGFLFQLPSKIYK